MAAWNLASCCTVGSPAALRPTVAGASSRQPSGSLLRSRIATVKQCSSMHKQRCRRLCMQAASVDTSSGGGSDYGASMDALAAEVLHQAFADLEQEFEGGEGTPPTEAEMEEARKALQDMLEGLGSAGVAQRPDDLELPPGGLSWAEVAQMVGMHGWRLADKVSPIIEEVVAQVEGCWRGELKDDGLGLYPLETEFKYLDSLDPQGADPFSFRSMPDPEKGEEGYPRLQIENRAYASRTFRKLHIEVAVRQDGLQIFHCVMYPHLNYEMPILSMDLVSSSGRVSLAIIDPCPVTPNLQLPPFYEAHVRDLQARYGLENNRSIPDWGRAIFSQSCVIMRPESSEELGKFLKYMLALTQTHVQLAKVAHPVSSTQRRRLQLVREAHQRYCDKQLENDKTRRVLEAAFNAPLAERYMRELMFDCPPALPEAV